MDVFAINTWKNRSTKLPFIYIMQHYCTLLIKATSLAFFHMEFGKRLKHQMQFRHYILIGTSRVIFSHSVIYEKTVIKQAFRKCKSVGEFKSVNSIYSRWDDLRNQLSFSVQSVEGSHIQFRMEVKLASKVSTGENVKWTVSQSNKILDVRRTEIKMKTWSCMVLPSTKIVSQPQKLIIGFAFLLFMVVPNQKEFESASHSI